jgi:hypothetical protein
MISLNEITTKYHNAVEYIDDVEARDLLKEIDSFIAFQKIQTSDPSLFQKLQKAIVHLKIVALAQISDEEAVDVLQNHYLESFDIQVSMETRLTCALFSVPYLVRDELREKFKMAIMKNQQILGPLTIGQWIAEFEKAFPVATRDISAPMEFIRTNPQIENLKAIDREKLKKIIHTYDYYLVTTLPATGQILEHLLAANPLPKSANRTAYPARSRNSFSEIRRPAETLDASKMTSMTLSESMKSFPEIGEQIVTSDHIKILSFPEPVRPSIKNWLADYTFILGYEKHDSVARSNYLFHEKNTQNLRSTDRQRLSYILKAFDENSLVPINKDAKQLIFSFPYESPRENETMQRAQESKDTKQHTKLEAPDFQLPTPPTGRQIPNNYPGQRASFQKNSPQALPTRPLRNSFSEESKQENQFPRNKEQGTNNIQSPNPKSQTDIPQNGAPRATNQETRPADPLRNNFSEADRQAQTGNMIFSSPQKLPYESEAPMRKKNSLSFPPIPANLPIKTPPPAAPSRSNTIVLQKKPDPPRPEGKNVVDLREG